MSEESTVGLYHPHADTYRTGKNVRLYRFHLRTARLWGADDWGSPAPVRLDPEDPGVVV